MTVRMWAEGRVGRVEMDNPPVNAIGAATRAGLLKAVAWAEEKRLERVILTGAGRAFAAGADAREFDADPVEPHLPDVLNRIEASPVPWIAVIGGVALGGGCEIALACRARVAGPKAQLGLPEVTLGVIPGAGGTQRLPRLIGLAPALDMIVTGKPVGAGRALDLGLVHAVDEDPLGWAEMLNAEALDTLVPVGDLNPPAADAAVLAAARATAEAKMRGQVAPLRAVAAVEAGLALPLAEGMAGERAAFLELRQGAQAKALRHMFFAERAARGRAWRGGTPALLDTVAVVGGGTMGAGIAYGLLNAGLKVVLLETDAAGVDRAEANVGRIIEQSQKRGLIDEGGAAARRAALTVTDDYARAGEATLAIEAAFESLEVKRTVFAALEAALPPEAVLATNTSYLDIDEIAAGVGDPSRVLGLHFFAPAHIMKLLEIVRGKATSDDALATGFALGKRLGKVPVVAGVCDGFIGNRILARYREAADTVFMDGSTPWEVDEAMVEFGYAMGPYEAQDLSGLDIAHANRRRQDATRDPNRRYIPIADRMVELGKLGKKTGAGWYRYPGGNGKVEDPIVADLALEEAHFAGITRTDYGPDEIRHRLVLAMINEACDILHEGIAESAADIDLVTVFGYGFPRWRGGLMHHADTLGPPAVLAGLQALAAEDPVAWRPSPFVEGAVAAGLSFADFAARED
jgi:3-hydroxyacyl-CoA dehydrogenase